MKIKGQWNFDYFLLNDSINHLQSLPISIPILMNEQHPIFTFAMGNGALIHVKRHKHISSVSTFKALWI